MGFVLLFPKVNHPAIVPASGASPWFALGPLSALKAHVGEDGRSCVLVEGRIERDRGKLLPGRAGKWPRHGDESRAPGQIAGVCSCEHSATAHFLSAPWPAASWGPRLAAVMNDRAYPLDRELW